MLLMFIIAPILIIFIGFTIAASIAHRIKGTKPDYKSDILAREEKTRLLRQWIDDQKNGGPLKGTPRPLTTDEEEAFR